MGLRSSEIEIEGVAQGQKVDWQCYATHDIVFASCLLRAREQHIDVQGKERRRMESGDTRNASYGTRIGEDGPYSRWRGEMEYW